MPLDFMFNRRSFPTIVFVFLFAWTALARAEQPAYVLDLSGEASLKTIFDSGLRPTNVYMGERSKCEVWNCALILIGKQGVRLPLSVEYAEFSVSGDNEITELFAKTRNLNLADAQLESTRLFALVGASPETLIDALSRAKESRSYDHLRNIESGTARGIEPEIGVGFVPGDFVPQAPQDLHVRIGVRFYWRSRVWHSKLRDTPIQPPAGYEQFSMQPVPSPSEIRRRQK